MNSTARQTRLKNQVMPLKKKQTAYAKLRRSSVKPMRLQTVHGKSLTRVAEASSDRELLRDRYCLIKLDGEEL
jgi:hypothetical protein